VPLHSPLSSGATASPDRAAFRRSRRGRAPHFVPLGEGLNDSMDGRLAVATAQTDLEGFYAPPLAENTTIGWL
jgi:hypothetical protein